MPASVNRVDGGKRKYDAAVSVVCNVERAVCATKQYLNDFESRTNEFEPQFISGQHVFSQ